MDRLEQYRIFIQVAQKRSFIGAAQVLGTPRASVSAAVQQLENAMGTRLLHRTTRQVSLTPDGQQLFERLLPLLEEAEHVEQLFHAEPRQVIGRLHVDVPSRIARRLLVPALPTLLRAHPQLSLTLGSSDRSVNLAQDGIDCVIRVGQVQTSSLVAKPLGTVHMVNCASPAYLDEYGVPTHLDELEQHWAVGYATAAGQDSPWEYLDPQGQLQTVLMRSKVQVNTVETYITCCHAGLGLIQVPRYDVQEQLMQQSLVEVLPDWPAPAMPVTVLYSHRKQRSRRLLVFIEWLQALLEPYLEDPSYRNHRA